MRRVRIKKIPKAKAGGAANGYTNTVPEQYGNWGGADISQNKMSDISTRRTLAPVPREEANIEAEKGEVAYGDINGDGFFETYVVGGKRHNNGGTPLALPEGTFIFSDFRDMLIKDPNILEMFGKTGKKKKGYTPAALAKSYDINKYREILQDPNSDKHDMDTAETMIKEYQFKLGALALAQEAQKNFEQGIPIVARPYMEKMGITDEDILPQEQMTNQPQEMPQEMSMENQMPMARYGWNDRSDLEMFIPRDESQVNRDAPPGMHWMYDQAEPYLMYDDEHYAYGGYIPKAQKGIPDGFYTYGPNSHKYENEGTEANPIQYTVPYQRGGSLPEYQDGGGITLIRGDYDTDEEWQRARYDAFKKAERSGKKVYVLTPQGRRELTRSGRTAQSYLDTYDQYDTEGWADQRGVGVIYNRMMESLESDAVRQHYIDAVNEAIANPESYIDKHQNPGTNWTQRSWAEATPEEIMEATRSHQNRNMRFIAHNINPRMFNDSGTKLDTKENIATKLGISVADAEAKIKEYKSKGWKSIKEVSELVGVPLSDDARIRALEQATYWGGVNISKKLAAGEYSEDEAYALRHFIDNPMKSAWGEDDEDQGSISPIDSIYGDTTAGHLNPYGEYVYTEGDLLEEEGDPDHLDPSKPKPKGPAPWWLQDEINMAGNLIDRSYAKKYLPWAQSIDLEEADPSFVDPTFTANSINAGLRTSQDALAQFTGSPQAASARAMALQGRGAEQVARAINQYDTQNVGIANQFEGQNVGIRNQELMYNNAMRDKLFDENVIANQQYDNTKAAYRAQGRMLYNNALTNRWKTDALNQMYPDYAVDPSVGGRMYHDPNYKDPNPTRRTNNFDIWYEHYRDEGMTHSEATEAARRADASDNTSSGGRNMTPFEQQYAAHSYGAIPGGQKGGYVMGSNVFPFMFY